MLWKGKDKRDISTSRFHWRKSYDRDRLIILSKDFRTRERLRRGVEKKGGSETKTRTKVSTVFFENVRATSFALLLQIFYLYERQSGCNFYIRCVHVSVKESETKRKSKFNRMQLRFIT